MVKESASEASDPGGFLLIKALAMPLIDPPLEIHWLPDLRFPPPKPPPRGRPIDQDAPARP